MNQPASDSGVDLVEVERPRAMKRIEVGRTLRPLQRRMPLRRRHRRRDGLNRWRGFEPRLDDRRVSALLPGLGPGRVKELLGPGQEDVADVRKRFGLELRSRRRLRKPARNLGAVEVW